MKTKNTIAIFLLSISLTLCFNSCEDFVEIDSPRTELVRVTVFDSDQTATAAMAGMYGQLIGAESFACGYTSSISFLAGLSADETNNYSTFSLEFGHFNENTLQSKNIYILRIWSNLYKTIYRANAILEGLPNSKVSVNLKKQFEGEAKFLRAFCHFYLVNLFGDVPLVLTTDYRTNATIPRTSADAVYNQLRQDLIDAQTLLSEDYFYSNGERVRPNKSAATALLSRVYLYQKDWENAEVQATILIGNTSTYAIIELNTVFLASSMEAIWQLASTTFNTLDAYSYLYSSLSGPRNGAMTQSLVNSFETDDKRFLSWVSVKDNGVTTYYLPNKYKALTLPVTENSMVLRLAEQYLIRAEARAQQDKIVVAQDDLNVIRERAGLPNTLASDKSSLLLAIEQERKVEFFTEWGHRWLDLKRIGRIDEVLKPLKTSWDENVDELYPIPESQILNDTGMKGAQNSGY